MLSHGTREAIDELEYPITTEELVEAVGDRRLLDGTETVEDALGRLGPERYERPRDARFALYTGISGTAIGRRHYSDREPSTGDALGGREQVSF
ncbi:DUF2795 domain-containing protein [Halobacteriales archaeon QS_8_69_26]|nr:MAG: DUF2795 domain-containing protein [Halobacteriales archaeon QS_8_69_26]